LLWFGKGSIVTSYDRTWFNSPARQDSNFLIILRKHKLRDRKNRTYLLFVRRRICLILVQIYFKSWLLILDLTLCNVFSKKEYTNNNSDVRHNDIITLCFLISSKSLRALSLLNGHIRLSSDNITFRCFPFAEESDWVGNELSSALKASKYPVRGLSGYKVCREALYLFHVSKIIPELEGF
jgi:hypothetical protein